MSRTLTPLSGTAGVTYTTRDGTPYRCDAYGVVYVNGTHGTELTTRGLATLTAAQLTAAHHLGESALVAENVKDHG